MKHLIVLDFRLQKKVYYFYRFVKNKKFYHLFWNKNQSTTILPGYKYMPGFLKKSFGLVKILWTMKLNLFGILETMSSLTLLLVSTVDFRILLLSRGDELRRAHLPLFSRDTFFSISLHLWFLLSSPLWDCWFKERRVGCTSSGQLSTQNIRQDSPIYSL